MKFIYEHEQAFRADDYLCMFGICEDTELIMWLWCYANLSDRIMEGAAKRIKRSM